MQIVNTLLLNIKSWWLNNWWTSPDKLWALKVSIAISCLVIPCCLMGQAFIGTTLALGVVGAALSESDDHPNGRAITLFFTILSFIVVSIAVEVLQPYPIIFGVWLAVSTFFLIIIGGISPRFQGLTFGALLISIYTLLGTGIKPWYYQPILLPLGGLIYGIISWALLYIRPYRLLKEQLYRSYSALAEYFLLKSSLFPSTYKEQKNIRLGLAEKNIAVGQAIDQAKQVIYAFAKVLQNKNYTKLNEFYYKWMLLQQLQERATSSHERYDYLTHHSNYPLIMNGFGKYMQEIALSINNYGKSILLDKPFIVSPSLLWTQKALSSQVGSLKGQESYPALSLLLQNLQKMVELLSNTDFNHTQQFNIINNNSINIKELDIDKIVPLFSTQHPRFRHAIRLVICFIVGYLIMTYFNLTKGEWVILTSLFVCQQSYIATRQRLLQRIMGTLLGVILGVVFSSLLPTIAGEIVLLISSIYAFYYWLRKNYAYAVIYITMFVVAAFNLQTGQGIAVMGPRIIATLIGACIAFVSVRFIWPDWQYKHLPNLISTAIDKNLRYFQTIYKGTDRGEVYYHNRRRAHIADNKLTTAWKGMFIEPKSKQKMLRKAYWLTFINHSLLSYISALGSHYYNTPLPKEELQYCEQISKLLISAKNNIINLEPASKENLNKAKVLVAQLWQQRLNQNLPSMVIIYNIACLTKDLLYMNVEK